MNKYILDIFKTMSIRPSVFLKLKISVTAEPIEFYSSGNLYLLVLWWFLAIFFPPPPSPHKKILQKIIFYSIYYFPLPLGTKPQLNIPIFSFLVRLQTDYYLLDWNWLRVILTPPPFLSQLLLKLKG